jgi:hypothetical protein
MPLRKCGAFRPRASWAENRNRVSDAGRARASAPRVRDIDTIDSELRLLVAICNMVREVDGRTPSTAYIDMLLDERHKLISAQSTTALTLVL